MKYLLILLFGLACTRNVPPSKIVTEDTLDRWLGYHAIGEYAYKAGDPMLGETLANMTRDDSLYYYISILSGDRGGLAPSIYKSYDPSFKPYSLLKSKKLFISGNHACYRHTWGLYCDSNNIPYPDSIQERLNTFRCKENHPDK